MLIESIEPGSRTPNGSTLLVPSANLTFTLVLDVIVDPECVFRHAGVVGSRNCALRKAS